MEVFNQKNEKIESIELPEKIFKAKWNPDLVHQTLLVQLANRRRLWSHVKDRSEVRGGGRKPWRQKGTGRARHGSVRSPLWPGGGVTFGPNKTRNLTRKISGRMRRLALFSVLSKKLADNKIKIVESMNFDEYKTKNLKAFIKTVIPEAKSVLLVAGDNGRKINLGARNLEKTGTISPLSLNIYDLLCYDSIVFDKKALEIAGKHYQKS